MESLSCTKSGHDNKPILGICMSQTCKSDQRIFCFTCLQKIHVDCKSQIYEKDQFLNQLRELKSKTQKEKEPKIKTVARELAQKLQAFTKELESFTIKILLELKRINPIESIDKILGKQNILSAQDWREGYKLLTEKVEIVPQSTKGLIEQINQIKQILDQITQIQNIQQPIQNILIQPKPVESNWGNITKDNPRIIKTLHQVSTISLSPNSKYLASAGDSNYSIQIWDPITGSQIGKLEGHQNWIWSINFSKCGKFLVSGSGDKTIRQWDVSTFKQIGEAMLGHESYLRGVEYSPDKKYIISCSEDKTIRVWNQKSGKEQINKRIQHNNNTYSLSLSSINNEIAFGDDHGMITIWDYEKHMQSGQLKGHTSFINSVKYSTDDKLIISGSDDRSIILWDSKTRTQIRSFIGHTNAVQSVNFSPDQKYIISGGYDHTVRIWDRETGQQIGQNLTHHTSYVYSTQFSLCGKYIITGGYDYQIMIMIAPMI